MRWQPCIAAGALGILSATVGRSAPSLQPSLPSTVLEQALAPASLTTREELQATPAFFTSLAQSFPEVIDSLKGPAAITPLGNQGGANSFRAFMAEGGVGRLRILFLYSGEGVVTGHLHLMKWIEALFHGQPGRKVKTIHVSNATTHEAYGDYTPTELQQQGLPFSFGGKGQALEIFVETTPDQRVDILLLNLYQSEHHQAKQLVLNDLLALTPREALAEYGVEGTKDLVRAASQLLPEADAQLAEWNPPLYHAVMHEEPTERTDRNLQRRLLSLLRPALFKAPDSEESLPPNVLRTIAELLEANPHVSRKIKEEDGVAQYLFNAGSDRLIIALWLGDGQNAKQAHIDVRALHNWTDPFFRISITILDLARGQISRVLTAGSDQTLRYPFKDAGVLRLLPGHSVQHSDAYHLILFWWLGIHHGGARQLANQTAEEARQHFGADGLAWVVEAGALYGDSAVRHRIQQWDKTRFQEVESGTRSLAEKRLLFVLRFLAATRHEAHTAEFLSHLNEHIYFAQRGPASPVHWFGNVARDIAMFSVLVDGELRLMFIRTAKEAATEVVVEKMKTLLKRDLQAIPQPFADERNPGVALSGTAFQLNPVGVTILREIDAPTTAPRPLVAQAA